MRQNNGRDSHFCGSTTFHAMIVNTFFLSYNIQEWHLKEWSKKAPKLGPNESSNGSSHNNENCFETFSRRINENVQKSYGVDSIRSTFLIFFVVVVVVVAILLLLQTNCQQNFTACHNKQAHLYDIKS